MAPTISPLAGTIGLLATRVDVQALLKAYYELSPDSGVVSQRVSFGTSGHRGSSFERSFNQPHVWAIVQAICDYRACNGISGPLYLGIDTHALSQPAFESALEILAGNGVHVYIAAHSEYTPTPVISHAILRYNSGRTQALSDGIVITPSHNPPDSGGIKYNAANGGPADTAVTSWIQTRANELLNQRLTGLKRVQFAEALRADTTHTINFLENYVADLANVVDMDSIARSGLRIGVDPMGGAGLHYWPRIAERFAINLSVINTQLDPQFGFVPLDWDGKIRMDPSSAFAMQRLIAARDQFDIAVACDTDHDRHGVVVPEVGLLSSNYYLSAAIDYLGAHRPLWRADAGIGKTIVSTSMLDRIAAKQGRSLFDAPVGFKYFSQALREASLVFACEESAGASFSRFDGSVWTTDKDGISAALLAAEMTAVTGQNPAKRYRELENELGVIYGDRLEAPASAEQKARLAKLAPNHFAQSTLAGDEIMSVLDHAPSNGAAIGGIKVNSTNGWFAARPSGTEAIYKIYAESFRSAEHLRAILSDAQILIAGALESAND